MPTLAHTIMRPLVLLASSLLVLGAARPHDCTNLHGAQVLRVVPERAGQVHYLRGLLLQGNYDFWTEPRAVGHPVDIMVRAFQLPQLKKTLSQVGLRYTVKISNVAALLAKERTTQEAARASGSRAMDWTSYHTYQEIMDWLESLAADHPDLCKVENVGSSFEGRTMKMLTLGKGGPGKPAIFIDGGIHAREWISPATVTYMINELVTKRDTYDDILSNVNFYFMPSINPDGYDYTFTDDRLWRKTRSDTNSLLGCMGVDPNRNWGFHWMEIGASDDPCSEVYAGTEPFSEVEMRNVRDQISQRSSSIKVYLTYHSYSQVWLYPWGWTSQPPEDWQDLKDLAQSAAEGVLSVHGTLYDVHNSGGAAGGSDDWAKGEANVKYSYTIELRDTGEYGFLLPPEQIIPTGEENLEGLKVVANFIKDTYDP
ncbi:carboxypeptidase B-like [Panulirus ornatus]|uniref:carboxypeptidase B-like n=1 Tax=Panulirus ornatus TaxID=150431 RepID=UPI003A8384AA